MSLTETTPDQSKKNPLLDMPQDPQEIAKALFRLPLALYRLGWGGALGWLPLLVLTTEGRVSGLPRHVLVEYRRHGSRYYIVSAWGDSSDWYLNALKNQNVTLQVGDQVVAATAEAVDDPAEALRALYMYSRNSPVYETLFAQMSSAKSADLNTLADVVAEFSVLRLEPNDEAPVLPPVELYSESTRQMALIVVALAGLWLLFRLLGGGGERKRR